MASNLMGIGVSVFLRDHFTSRATRVAGSMRNLHRSALGMNRGMLESVRAQSMGMATLGGLATIGMGKAIGKAADFGYTMKFVQQVTEANGEEFKQMENRALSLGQTTMFTSQQIADGMKFMGMAGMDYADVVENIGAATNLAGATQTMLHGKGGAADIMTNIMRTFQLEATESARVSDILTAVTTGTNTGLYDLGQAVAYAGSTVKGLGIPLEESTTMLGLLGNAGIQGSMAGTSLANMYRFLAKATGEFRTGKQGKALAQLGLTPDDLKDANGELLGTRELLTTFLKAAEGKTNLEGKTLLEALFGIRGERGATPLLQQLEEYDKVLAKVKGSQGLAGDRMGEVMQTTKGQMLQLSSAWQNMMTVFGQRLEPIVVPLLKAITKIIQGITWLFSGNMLGGFLASGIAGFIAIRTAAHLYKIALTTIALAYTRNGTLFAQRVARTTAGYNTMTASANRYAAASARGGINTRGFMGSHRGAYFNAHGRMVRSRTTGFGRAGQFMGRGPGSVGARYLSRFGSRGMMGAGGILSRIAPMFGRLLGFLGGPWGLALSFGIPAIIGLLRGSVDKNTEALTTKTSDPLEKVYWSRDRYRAPEATTWDNPELKAAREKAFQESLSKPGHQPAIHVHIDGVSEKAAEIAQNTFRINTKY